MPSMRLNNTLAAFRRWQLSSSRLLLRARAWAELDTEAARSPGQGRSPCSSVGRSRHGRPSSWVQQSGVRLAQHGGSGTDLIALTQRLKTHSNAPAPRSVETHFPRLRHRHKTALQHSRPSQQNYYTLDLHPAVCHPARLLVREGRLQRGPRRAQGIGGLLR